MISDKQKEVFLLLTGNWIRIAFNGGDLAGWSHKTLHNWYNTSTAYDIEVAKVYENNYENN